MCLSFFVLDAAEGPRFLLAFNRDEYFDSRGGITTAFLTGDASPANFAQGRHQYHHHHHDFLQPASFFCVLGLGVGIPPPLPDAAAIGGPGGVSNGLLLEWPKVASGVAVLSQLLPEIRQGQPVPWSRLFIELLGDDTRLFGKYGTRSQTALVVWLDGRVEMRERAREPDGSWRESALDFAISL
eukprot:XP_001693989.1 predicted protein [Chlamydomonas reinhardtii]